MGKASLDAYRAKAASVNKIKESADEAEKANSLKSKSKFKKPHKIEMGENVYRVAPHHEPGENPYVPVYSTFLEVEKDEYSDGEKTGKKVLGKKPVFLASVHGPKDDKGNSIIKKDIVEIYITKTLDYVDENVQDDKEKKKILGFINGYRDRDGKFVGGIKPSLKYCCLAWDDKWELSELHITNKMLEDMNRESMKENADEEIATDVFSKIEQCSPLVLDKTKNAKDRIEYKVSAKGPKKGQDWNDFWDEYNITESLLEELHAEKSLDDRFVEVYTMKDFMIAMEGLKNVDDKIGLGILDSCIDEFEKVAELVPEAPDKSENGSSENESLKETSANTSSPKDSGGATPLQMKRDIGKYVEENYKGKELPKLKKPDIVKWYNLVLEGEELPFEDYEISDNTSATVETGDEVSEKTVSDVVNGIKNRRKK